MALKQAVTLDAIHPSKTSMRLLPWLTFFTIGRPFAGLFCLLLQITLIGWIPASIWAVYALSQYKTDQKIAAALVMRP